MSGPLPLALRVSSGAAPLEAAGRRAWIAASADGRMLEVVVAGARAAIELEPPLASGVVETWPFAAIRDAPVSRQMAFAAPDQPVVMLELDPAPESLRARITQGGALARMNDADVTREWADAIPDENGRVRIVVRAAGIPLPDIDALMAGAVARTRRGVAQRLRVRTHEADEDVVAVYERSLWLDLGANPEMPPEGRLAVALALLALNDARGALEAMRPEAAALADDAALATVAAGAWAAWRGEMVPLDAVRAAVTERHARSSYTSGDASVRTAATALQPFVADLIARDSGRSASRTDAGAAGFVAMAAHPRAPASARTLLELVHDRLGIVPDAARGRVRIGPRLEDGRLELEQIAVGDAILSLAAEVTAGSAVIDVEQTSGATPFTAILEPCVPARRLMSALVEDVPAELDVVPGDAGIRVRVQLIIDRRRRLVLNFERL